jgi:hypothetical protein
MQRRLKGNRMIEYILAYLVVISMIGMPIVGTILIVVDIIKSYNDPKKQCEDCKKDHRYGSCMLCDGQAYYVRKRWKFWRPK